VTQEEDGYPKMPYGGKVTRLFHYFEVIRIIDGKEGRKEEMYERDKRREMGEDS
jgi:hypothetical protein